MSKVTEIKNVIEQINKILEEIKEYELTNDEKMDYFFDNHEELTNKYPFLIKQFIDGNDLSMLNVMLRTLEEKEKYNLDNNTVDKQMGEILASQYLKQDKK